MVKFEKISKFAKADINLPVRKTTDSAGYDFEVAEDTVVPAFNFVPAPMESMVVPMTLDDAANYIKKHGGRPTLVPTGIKCYMEKGQYLELSVRSSCPLKYRLILANGVGIIDRDYVDNPDNEGHIFFQIINLSPFPILLRKGDIIGQGIIKTYGLVDDDSATGERVGGFGSTSSPKEIITMMEEALNG